MKYQIEAPNGTWTHNTVITLLADGAYLTVKLSQVNLQAPVVVEVAELRHLSQGFQHYLPVPLSDIEVIDHRGTKLAKIRSNTI